MRVTFRGVRGSVPWSVPDGIIHGCNTPCVEIVDEAHGLLILDAGSGIVGVSAADGPVSLVLTHYHWDHLLGLPFFTPLYQPGREITIHTPDVASHDPGWLDTIFRSPFFPVPYDQLPNKPRVALVESGAVGASGFTIRALHLNHPGGALAYRVTGAGGDFVYATDHEFGDLAFDEPLAAFAHGASALVLDAHFTPEELPQHRGWGHSDWRQCTEFAAANAVQRLYLFHHKPGRSDQSLADIRTQARAIFPNTDTAAEEISFIV